jgi:hypothetical protein
MDENQQYEIERRVNNAIASCQNCSGRTDLEQMQRNFHGSTINFSSPEDDGWPQVQEYLLPGRCNSCYVVDNELAVDE